MFDVQVKILFPCDSFQILIAQGDLKKHFQQCILSSIVFEHQRNFILKKSKFIQANASQLGILVLGIIGIVTLLLCLRPTIVNSCDEETGSNTVFFSSGGVENDFVALFGNTKKNNAYRINSSHRTTNPAEAKSDNSLAYLNFMSNIHNNQIIPLQSDPNCDIIIHTTPPRASPAFFV